MDLIAIVLVEGFNILKGAFDIFKGAFTGDWALMWEGIKTVFTAIWTGIKEALSVALTGINDYIKTVF